MSGMNGLSAAMDLALARRDAMVHLLAQARQSWIAAQLQLDQLENYSQECTQRWTQQSLRCSPEVMRHHYQFMARLDHAIALQRGVVAEQLRGVEHEAARLREAEARLGSLNQLVRARRDELGRIERRQEQKLADEQAALQHRRRLAAELGPML